jgi:hypothetical protein
MVSHPPGDSGTSVGGKERRPFTGRSRAPVLTPALELVRTFRRSTGADGAYRRAGGQALGPGTTSIFEVDPEVVLGCSRSGDVNQGREMEVLT